MLLNLFLYASSFLFIWIGSGLIVSSTSKFSRILKLSPFAFSFIFLGILTSTPEFSVGLQAVASHDAEIFVGNLLGGVVVLFLLVIPLLAILGNGISLKNELGKKTLPFAFLVIIAPSLLTLDKRVTNLEGGIMILLYFFLLVLVQKKDGILDKNIDLLNVKAYSYLDLLKILVGIGIVFVASNLIVEKTMYFGNYFNISAFYISLLVVAIGTNLPETTLAIRSVFTGKKDVAMGDYLGSAAANTLLFGIFTILHNGEVLTISNFLVTFTFISLALGLFYLLALTQNAISRRYGLLMIILYVLFIGFELFRR